MRLLTIIILLSFSTIARGQSDKVLKLRFDGFYQTAAEIDKKDKDTTVAFLRFYPNGQVLSVTAVGTAQDLKAWFNTDNKDVSKGHYEIKDNGLYFSTTSISGTVVYNGKIISQFLLSLKSKSLINGYKAKERFYFVKVEGLK